MYELITFARLIEHFMKHEGVEFVTMGYISDDFKRRNSPMPGAAMPAPVGAILKGDT
jgi:hypothetical protein